jgi:hypothetical protein
MLLIWMTLICTNVERHVRRDNCTNLKEKEQRKALLQTIWWKPVETVVVESYYVFRKSIIMYTEAVVSVIAYYFPPKVNAGPTSMSLQAKSKNDVVCWFILPITSSSSIVYTHATPSSERRSINFCAIS